MIQEGKVCLSCGINKCLSEYSKQKLGKLGRRGRCKECLKVDTKAYKDAHRKEIAEYYQNNKEHIKKKSLDRYNDENNRQSIIDKVKHYRHHKMTDEQKLKKARYNSEYGKTTVGRIKNCVNSALRRTRIKDNTSKLSSMEKKKIELLYAISNFINYKIGIQMHVDHIVPVCLGGGSNSDNLRVITAIDNLKKGGRL